MKIKPAPDRQELTAALAKSAAEFAAMSLDEQEAMLRRQRDGWIKAEMSWPRDCPYR